jgi:hypothetical protein
MLFESRKTNLYNLPFIDAAKSDALILKYLINTHKKTGSVVEPRGIGKVGNIQDILLEYKSSNHQFYQNIKRS